MGRADQVYDRIRRPQDSGERGRVERIANNRDGARGYTRCRRGPSQNPYAMASRQKRGSQSRSDIPRPTCDEDVTRQPRHCKLERVSRFSGRRRLAAVIIAVIAVLVAVRVEAQFGRNFFGIRRASENDIDGTFQFCRVEFRSHPAGDGGDWSVDWPRADINLSIRLSELTKTTVGRRSTGDPNFLLVRLTDDLLYQCPFIMMTEVGSAFFDDEEAEQLRDYLLKGGFLWADDFWGTDAWDWWEVQIEKVLPRSEYPIVDLDSTHPLYRAQFEIKQTPQIASIGMWQRLGGGTSERGEDSAEVHTRGIHDPKGRMMVLITHNTDLGDSFEREADDPAYFYTMSVPGYAFGVNALIYALTH